MIGVPPEETEGWNHLRTPITISGLCKAILRRIVIGIPVVLIGLTPGIWLITDNDLGDSIATALLPGVLPGAFGGGFAGVASAMG